jgi:hypothetical protein
MSNKKHGCAFCKEKDRSYKDVFNYRPFLRIITAYKKKKIDRKTFCIRWDRAQRIALLLGEFK